MKAVQAMYRGALSKMRVSHEYSDEFSVAAGVHQDSVPSPLLFIIVLQVITEKFKTGCPWELLYSDVYALIADSVTELEKNSRK